MRSFLFVLLSFWTAVAAADLYRWVDPETGSIKYSSYPPPWFGDAEKERRAPRVERIPAGKAPPPVKPDEALAAPRPKPSAFEFMEARYKEMLKSLTVFSEREDFNRAGSGLKQQLEAYNAVAAELDRLDPKGALSRKTDTQPLLDKLVEGLRTVYSPKPSAAEERGR